MLAVDALRACPLFQGFTETGLGILAGICAPKSYPQATVLFAENMVSDSMLVIVSGEVALSTKSDRGDISLGTLGQGDWLGELSLIQTGQRACTATAASAAAAYEIRQAEFQRLILSKPQACMKLLMAICTQFGGKVLANKKALTDLARG